MRDRGPRRLLSDVHRLRAVAVAAFQRIVGLEAGPAVLREPEALCEELLARVDEPEQMTPDLFRGLHLARDLVGPVVRHVAVRTACADAGAVGEMDRRFQLLENIVTHLVATGAELFGV